MIQRLYEIIIDRQMNPVSGSYTNQLFDAGLDKVLQKVGEETVELIIAASNQGKRRIIEESGDLIYHLLVLLVSTGISLEEVEKELKGRHIDR
jgi:phosphoribosyl-ATP pyrophosphohydrolase